MTLTKTAFAKINISLDIVSKMDDGYHYLKSVMQTVSLDDEVTIECAPAAIAQVTVDTGLPYVPNDQRNIAAKAALAFFARTGITGYCANIRIKKNIPVCAGLGGGSADAACVLRMLDEIFETALGREALEKLGYDIGADVPFCIDGGTKLAEGRGEILTDLQPLPSSRIIICKPPFSLSTPELFGCVKCKEIRTRPDTEGLLKAIEKGDLGGIARRMYNVFEDILPRGKSDIDEIKGEMLEHGALGTVMTGSGPTVIGLFDDKNCAEAAYSQLAQSYKECYLAEPIKEQLRPYSQLFPYSSGRKGSKMS